jgi:acetylornithine/succinyldiaminopimelate/putrescine aminotransferase/predicted amino acid dehydrogenase/acyl-coenzyme A synthetase/AMP-(fatty) acid ligase
VTLPSSGFDLTLSSPVPLPPFVAFRFRSLRELVSRPENADRPVVVGPIGDAERVVTFADLRDAAGRAAGWAAANGLVPGDSVLLARLPHTSEMPVASALFGLMTAGLRVVLPMTVSPAVGPLLDAIRCRAVLRWAGERGAFAASADTAPADEMLRKAAADRGLRIACVGELLETPPAPLSANLSPDREVLVLTTSGSAGGPKGVRYTERALLTGLEAWRAAGLLGDDLTGGPSLCPLLSHSMGVRNVLNAIAAGRPTLLLYPEWMTERPDLVGRYLLAWPPRHVTAGPALFHALARGMRQLPEIGHAIRRHLRFAVSSGSGFDPRLRELLPGVRIANAFGMTETQQVLTTLLGDTADGLGQPLPGVTVGVRFADREKRVGRLFVRSPFGAAGYVGGSAFGDWFDTGDLVRWDGRALHHAGRAAADFVNTGLGMKAAVADLDRRYAGAARDLEALVFFTAPGRAGPVAVGFVGDADPGDPALHARVREALAARHDDAETVLDPLEAVGLARDWPPARGVGKVDRDRIALEHADLLTALGDATAADPRVVVVPPPDRAGSAFRRCSYPHLGGLLELVRLDRSYTAGRGNWLTSADPPEDVLDLVGGYGANLLGHGHPDVRAAAERALGGVPLLDQGSVRGPVGELAERLARRLGRETGRRYVVCLASTGAEAVELALRHALFARRERFAEWQDYVRRAFGPTHPVETDACLAHNAAAFAARRPVLVALRGGFHGQTGGALHALGSDPRRRPFTNLLGLPTVFLGPTGDAESRELLRHTADTERLRLLTLVKRDGTAAVEEHALPDVIAVVAEPIQGEGGIVEVPADWLAELKVPGVPLIVDEIQCGLGRAGRFLASAGATADYYLFGKALGGGVAKVAAVAIDRERYRPAFDELRPSTFSDDAFSATVGTTVLDVIDRDGVPARAAAAGRQLREALVELRAEFPQVARSVRGRGLMLGLELGLPDGPDFPLLHALGRDRLGYLAASYLLNRHRIRVLPTLSAPDVLRLEPSAFLTADEIAHAAAGLRAFCRGLAAGDLFELTRHLVTRDTPDPTPYRGTATFRQPADTPPPGAERVGFVFPLVQPEAELLALEPAFQALAAGPRAELVRRLALILDGRPFVQFAHTLFGGRVWLAGVLVPVLPEAVQRAKEVGETGQLRDRIEEAVRLAADLGCRAVVLGGHTSSITADGTALRPPVGVRLATGNTFTVAVMVRQLAAACKEAGVTPDRVAVVGATGNIGSAAARVLAGTPTGRRLLLVGRPGSEDRLKAVAADIPCAAASTRLDDVAGCDAVLVAAGGCQPVLFPEHVAADRPVVVVDVSQPGAVSLRVKRVRPRAVVRSVGFVRLPEDAGFRASPFTPPGTVFACMAEAILLGLGTEADRLTGPINPAAVAALARAGERHGLLPAGG